MQPLNCAEECTNKDISTIENGPHGPDSISTASAQENDLACNNLHPNHEDAIKNNNFLISLQPKNIISTLQTFESTIHEVNTFHGDIQGEIFCYEALCPMDNTAGEPLIACKASSDPDAMRYY